MTNGRHVEVRGRRGPDRRARHDRRVLEQGEGRPLAGRQPVRPAGRDPDRGGPRRPRRLPGRQLQAVAELRPHVRGAGTSTTATAATASSPTSSSATAAHLLERLVPLPLHQRGREPRPGSSKGSNTSGNNERRHQGLLDHHLRPRHADVEKILLDGLRRGQPAHLGDASTRGEGARTASSSTTSRARPEDERQPRPRHATACRGTSRATTGCSRTRRTSSARRRSTTAGRSTT